MPTVTFEIPGDKLASERLHLPREPGADLPLWHFGHTADPIFVGVCNVMYIHIQFFCVHKMIKFFFLFCVCRVLQVVVGMVVMLWKQDVIQEKYVYGIQ